MDDTTLQDRLRGHARAFDGLLSLIPAKLYYGEDTSDQWNKKKQTKAEAVKARRGKLDPDSELNRNVKDAMDDRARAKRKLSDMQGIDGDEEEEEDAGDGVPNIMVEGIEMETPGQGLRKEKKKKKPKIVPPVAADADGSNNSEPQSEKPDDHTEAEAALPNRDEKTEKKEEKRRRRNEKAEERKKRHEQAEESEKEHEGPSTEPGQLAAQIIAESAEQSRRGGSLNNARDGTDIQRPESVASKAPNGDSGMARVEAGSHEKCDDPRPAPCGQSPPLRQEHPAPRTAGDPNPTNHATPASPSSPASLSSEGKPRHIKIPADTTALRARLAAKIESLRAARKADGTEAQPVRTRQELIELRRAKQTQRRAHKKELRQQAKLVEEQKREEALASNSPSMTSPLLGLDDDGDDDAAAGSSSNFSFGRIAFDDGAQLSRDLSYVLNRQGADADGALAKKGPSDPKTALIKLQNQKKRLEALDGEKRKDVEEKEAWLKARKRAEGEKVRDDEAILKKAVKRKEQAKKKSERGWQERTKGVEQAMKEKQKKREENIQKRKDDKSAGKAGKKKGGAGSKKKGRPGFEGSLRFGGGKKMSLGPRGA